MWLILMLKIVLHALTSKRSNKQFQYCPAACGDSPRWWLQQNTHCNSQGLHWCSRQPATANPTVSFTWQTFSFRYFSSQSSLSRGWYFCVREADVYGQQARKGDFWGGPTPLSAASWRFHKQTRVASGEATCNNNPSTRGKRQVELWTRCELSEPCEARGEEEVAVYCTGRKLAAAMFG